MRISHPSWILQFTNDPAFLSPMRHHIHHYPKHRKENISQVWTSCSSFFTQSSSTLLARYNQNNHFTFVKIQFLYMLEAFNSGSILLNPEQQSIHRQLFILSFLKYSPASKVSTCHRQLELSLRPKPQEERS